MILDKIYIITIDHSQENYNSIISRLAKLNIQTAVPYEIYPGVNGKEVFSTKEGRDKYGIKFYDGWKLTDSSNFWWTRNVTVGEAGGVCSHIKVWEDAYKNGYENILILEDDFNPITKFPWGYFSELDNYDWDIAYLSRILQSMVSTDIVDYDIEKNNWVSPGYSYQTHAYVINKSGLKKLVETNLPTLKQNIVVSDEFLPSTYTTHPRKDLQELFIKNMNAVATKWNPILQLRNAAYGNSQTEPIEGLD
jgi:GR25 family glycosyltransferase involved in LPS biosynthesis